MVLVEKTLHRRDAEIQGPGEKSERRIRYAGRYFSTASALPLHGGLTHPRRVLALAAASARRPRRLVALAVLLLRTRSELVFVSESLTGEALRAYFNERAWRVFPKHRLCQGVLLLPQNRSDYLRGRRRQALRTNLRRAAGAGITCEVMDERSRALDEAIEVFTHRQCRAPFTDAEARYLRSLFARPEMTFLAAHDKRGRPLAVTAVVIDDLACLIVFAVASSHDARWALHGHLVDVLIPGGVRYLIATDGGMFGALGFTPNVQQYQHLLGFELRHVTPVPAHPMRRQRRVLVSLAAAAATAASLFIPSALASAIEIRAPQALMGRTMFDAGSAIVHRFEHRNRDAG